MSSRAVIAAAAASFVEEKESSKRTIDIISRGPSAVKAGDGWIAQLKLYAYIQDYLAFPAAAAAVVGRQAVTRPWGKLLLLLFIHRP